MTFEAIEFGTAGAAIQHTYASGLGMAVWVAGRTLVVAEEIAIRLAAGGINFAYLCDYTLPNGGHRIVTVPVN